MPLPQGSLNTNSARRIGVRWARTKRVLNGNNTLHLGRIRSRSSFVGLELQLGSEISPLPSAR